MTGVIINCISVIVGCLAGMLFSKRIPKRITDSIMTAMGLCVLYIGISGAFQGKNALTLIISMAIGGALGTLIDIDDKINKLGAWITKKFSGQGHGNRMAEGFVNASILFCVGSMALVGSIQAGTVGDNTILITKAMIDMVSAVALGATFGLGVALSSVFILAFQGGLVLLAVILEPLLTEAIQAEMICAGSVIIMAIGMNMIGITKIKVANYIPAMFLAGLICPLMDKIM